MSVIVDLASVDENKRPDYHAFKAWGGSGVILRGAFTFRGTAFTDPIVSRDRNAIADAGLTFGAYLILGWTVDPITQAKKMIEACGKAMPGDFPVFVDVEFPGQHGIRDFGISPAEALAKITIAIQVLEDAYGVVGVYTSERVWREDMSMIPSDIGRRCPLWFKTGYPMKARSPANTMLRGPFGKMPTPWTDPGGPGGWIRQYQGDATGVPGFSSTVDLNEFIPYDVAKPEQARAAWIVSRLADHNALVTSDFLATIRSFQTANGLTADGVIGPKTFAALCT